MKSLVLVLLISYVLVQFANAFNMCSSRKMWNAHNEMRRVSCRNCDKYFHCLGNFNAIYGCPGSMEDKRKTAELITNMREWGVFERSNDNTVESAADQRASRFGRNGGSCTVYLKAVRCAYNPISKICG